MALARPGLSCGLEAALSPGSRVEQRAPAGRRHSLTGRRAAGAHLAGGLSLWLHAGGGPGLWLLRRKASWLLRAGGAAGRCYLAASRSARAGTPASTATTLGGPSPTPRPQQGRGGRFDSRLEPPMPAPSETCLGEPQSSPRVRILAKNGGNPSLLGCPEESS